MRKCLRGYITVEASYLMPIVLIIYCTLIMGGFYLYDRCVISQDTFLLALRGSRFTFASSHYGEVIYGEEYENTYTENYIKERLNHKAKGYPFLNAEILNAERNKEAVQVSVSGFHGTLSVSKNVKVQNPMQKVKEVRRIKNGS